MLFLLLFLFFNGSFAYFSDNGTHLIISSQTLGGLDSTFFSNITRIGYESINILNITALNFRFNFYACKQIVIQDSYLYYNESFSRKRFSQSTTSSNVPTLFPSGGLTIPILNQTVCLDDGSLLNVINNTGTLTFKNNLIESSIIDARLISIYNSKNTIALNNTFVLKDTNLFGSNVQPLINLGVFRDFKNVTNKKESLFFSKSVIYFENPDLLTVELNSLSINPSTTSSNINKTSEYIIFGGSTSILQSELDFLVFSNLSFIRLKMTTNFIVTLNENSISIKNNYFKNELKNTPSLQYFLIFLGIELNGYSLKNLHFIFGQFGEYGEISSLNYTTYQYLPNYLSKNNQDFIPYSFIVDIEPLESDFNGWDICHYKCRMSCDRSLQLSILDISREGVCYNRQLFKVSEVALSNSRHSQLYLEESIINRAIIISSKNLKFKSLTIKKLITNSSLGERLSIYVSSDNLSSKYYRELLNTPLYITNNGSSDFNTLKSILFLRTTNTYSLNEFDPSSTTSILPLVDQISGSYLDNVFFENTDFYLDTTKDTDTLFSFRSTNPTNPTSLFTLDTFSLYNCSLRFQSSDTSSFQADYNLFDHILSTYSAILSQNLDYIKNLLITDSLLRNVDQIIPKTQKIPNSFVFKRNSVYNSENGLVYWNGALLNVPSSNFRSSSPSPLIDISGNSFNASNIFQYVLELHFIRLESIVNGSISITNNFYSQPMAIYTMEASVYSFSNISGGNSLNFLSNVGNGNTLTGMNFAFVESLPCNYLTLKRLYVLNPNFHGINLDFSCGLFNCTGDGCLKNPTNTTLSCIVDSRVDKVNPDYASIYFDSLTLAVSLCNMIGQRTIQILYPTTLIESGIAFTNNQNLDGIIPLLNETLLIQPFYSNQTIYLIGNSHTIKKTSALSTSGGDFSVEFSSIKFINSLGVSEFFDYNSVDETLNSRTPFIIESVIENNLFVSQISLKNCSFYNVFGKSNVTQFMNHLLLNYNSLSISSIESISKNYTLFIESAGSLFKNFTTTTNIILFLDINGTISIEDSSFYGSEVYGIRAYLYTNSAALQLTNKQTPKRQLVLKNVLGNLQNSGFMWIYGIKTLNLDGLSCIYECGGRGTYDFYSAILRFSFFEGISVDINNLRLPNMESQTTTLGNPFKDTFGYVNGYLTGLDLGNLQNSAFNQFQTFRIKNTLIQNYPVGIRLETLSPSSITLLNTTILKYDDFRKYLRQVIFDNDPNMSNNSIIGSKYDIKLGYPAHDNYAQLSNYCNNLCEPIINVVECTISQEAPGSGINSALTLNYNDINVAIKKCPKDTILFLESNYYGAIESDFISDVKYTNYFKIISYVGTTIHSKNHLLIQNQTRFSLNPDQFPSIEFNNLYFYHNATISPLSNIGSFNQTTLMNPNYFIEIKPFGPITNTLVFKHFNQLSFSYCRFNTLLKLSMNSIVCIDCIIRGFYLSNSIIESERYTLYIKQPDYYNDGNQVTTELILNTNKLSTTSNIHLLHIFYTPTLILDKNEFKCLGTNYISSDTIGSLSYTIFEVNKQCIFTSNVGNGNQVLPTTYQFSENSMISGTSTIPIINSTNELFSIYTHEFGYAMNLEDFNTKTLNVKNNYLLLTSKSVHFVLTFIIKDIDSSYPCVESDNIFIEKLSNRNKLTISDRQKAHIAILDPNGIILNVFETNNTAKTECFIYDPNKNFGDSMKFLIGAIFILVFMIVFLWCIFCGGVEITTLTTDTNVEPSLLAINRRMLKDQKTE
jgi:hypothetical protein